MLIVKLTKGLMGAAWASEVSDRRFQGLHTNCPGLRIHACSRCCDPMLEAERPSSKAAGRKRAAELQQVR